MSNKSIDLSNCVYLFKTVQVVQTHDTSTGSYAVKSEFNEIKVKTLIVIYFYYYRLNIIIILYLFIHVVVVEFYRFEWSHDILYWNP